MVEVGPVHRHQGVLAAGQLMRHPAGEAVPHVDGLVAQQPVHLLDRMLRHQAARLRQGLADHGHRKRRARHHAKRSASQRIDPLGVQIMGVQFADETPDVLKTPARLTRCNHFDAPTQHGSMQLDNPTESGLPSRQ